MILGRTRARDRSRGHGGSPVNTLWSADFSGATPGVASLPSGLSLSRTGARTAQTSASTVLLTGLTTDNTAAIGSDGTHSGLLIEEARTNQVEDSRDLTAASWTAGASVVMTANAAAGPDGSSVATQANVSSGGFSNYRAQVNAATVTASAWLRNVSGSTGYQLNIFGAASHASAGSLTTSWARASFLQAPATNGFVPCECRDMSGSGGVAATARNEYIDLAQIEVGSFATEAIVTSGGTAARNGERLYYSSGSALIDGGAMAMSLSIQPKGSSSQYSANMTLWLIDADNYAQFVAANGKVIVTVGGVSYTTAVAASWSAGDTLDVFVSAGGGVATKVQYRVNGGAATTLSTGSPTAFGTITNSGALDLVSDNHTGTPISQFSGWVRQIAFWKSGKTPTWVT